MKVKTIITGELQTNTYLIIDEKNKKALIVDPGGDLEMIIEELSHEDLSLEAILITHGHFDHIGVAESLKEHFNVSIYAHKEEAEIMKDPRKNLSSYFYGTRITAHADQLIKEDDILDLGDEFSFKCIVVSGHTDYSVCFYNEKHNYVLTGDTLMAGSMGRTDLNNKSTSFLAQNIKDQLFVLPENTLVYPGHGESTQIGIEKIHNPFLANEW